jgi:type IV pilus assembly protein PilY1
MKRTRKPYLVAGSFLFVMHCVFVFLPSQAATPEVKIANGPLFSGRGNVHPNVLLSLSVEFPTAGIAYRGDNGTYNRNVEYIGYFNPAKCYVYNGGNRNLSSTGYFRIHKSADSATRECGGDSFSGNFMNWATSSAIDVLRYALTGGDRVIDTPTQTVLQRAVLRDSEKNNFYAHGTYFPRRKVIATSNTSAPNQVTPFNTSTLYVVSCRNRILFSDTSSGLVGNKDADSKVAGSFCTSVYDGTGVPPADAVDKKLGEYLARVEVCDGKEGAERIDLCQKYANGYKPVGVLQRKSEKVRVAAMSYLLDDAEKRYGGVLRAPMKYLGSKKIEAPGFLASANDRLEWNPDTGVFYSNPEDPVDRNSTVVRSGVISYLNKFGDTGVYKTFDPVGELFYEGIRYLQGKSPTPEAVTNVTDAMKDRFPVIDAWVDPVIASCQQNHILSIADVNTHWDRYVPGNDRVTYGAGSDAFDKARAADLAVAGKTPGLDVKVWTKKVGDMEVDAGGAYANLAKSVGMTDLHNKDTGSGGHGTYYMAGLAYWANTNDIRLDKPTRVKTFAIDVDEGGNGLIDGNTRTIKPRDSQLYLAAKYGGFDDRNNDGNPFITLAADGKTIVKGSNAEWDNGNGVPSNYFLASQPREMINSIRKIFDTIGAASGTIAAVSVSGTKMSSDGAFVYQPGFESSKWSGKLQKLALKPGIAGTIDISKTALWDAGELLTGTGGKPANPLPGARNIYTASVAADGSLSTIEFKWDKLTETQKALLDVSPADKVVDGRGEKRVNFLRGERSLEASQPNGIFRAREKVLGDIVNSNAIYVAAPAMNVQGAGYQEFYKNYESRSRVVYVGANDGMLHAFSADDGQELFAYVPNAVMPRLNLLTQPEYEHQAYVDGTISVGEASAGGQWKTVLVSGLGGGAQGVFALDVTNPDSFGKGRGAMFEFTDADDPDMGNLMTAPVIAKFRTSPAGSAAEYKYFAVVASGFNNYKPDGYRADGKPKFNSDAAAALFLLSLDKAASDKWQQNVNYYKFRISSKDPSQQNGLSTPALVVGASGAVLYAYAGDLQGNLWRLDFTGPAPWAKALPNATPLFVAKDASGKRQAISTLPKVVFAPGGGYVVLFGTGKFIEDADAASGNFSTQSFYGIFDAKKSEYTVSGRSELMPRVLEKSGEDAFKISGAEFSYGSGANDKKGWYFDFPDSSKTGERVVTNPLLADGLLFFNSVIPGSDPCAAGGGRSYVLNTLSGVPSNGAPTGYLSLVGMLSSPVLLQTGADVGDRNATGKRAAKKRFSVVNFGTGGVKGTAASTQNGNGEVAVRAGRISWREVINWQELRNVLKK